MAKRDRSAPAETPTSETFSLGGFARTVAFRDREVEISIDDFTWEEVDLFRQVAGVDLAQAFGSLLEPRLLAVALWLVERRTAPTTSWKAFAATINPYRDIALVVPRQDEDADPEAEAATPDESADPEA
jgi:hypothetical protein